jgi:hypothetical protein
VANENSFALLFELPCFCAVSLVSYLTHGPDFLLAQCVNVAVLSVVGTMELFPKVW